MKRPVRQRPPNATCVVRVQQAQAVRRIGLVPDPIRWGLHQQLRHPRFEQPPAVWWVGQQWHGSGHGEYGFTEFTHLRGVYEQRFDGAGALLMPPYTPWKTKLVDRLLRWL